MSNGRALPSLALAFLLSSGLSKLVEVPELKAKRLLCEMAQATFIFRSGFPEFQAFIQPSRDRT